MRGTPENNYGRSRTNERPVVPSPSTANRSAVETAVEKGCSLTGGRNNQKLPGNWPATLGLTGEWERLERMGLSQDVVHPIQGAHAASTTACYTYKWTAFQRWCLEKSANLISCPLCCILSFSQLLIDRNLVFSMIKTYAAAISSCHEDFNERTVFNCSLGKHFLKDVHRHKPVSRTSVPQWDQALILHAVTEELFEPLDQISLKFLSFKTALLLAMTSAKRVSDLS